MSVLSIIQYQSIYRVGLTFGAERYLFNSLFLAIFKKGVLVASALNSVIL